METYSGTEPFPAPLPQLCTHCSRQMLSLPACAVLLFPLVLLVLLAAQPPARLDCSPASCRHVPAPTLTAPERTQHQVSGRLLAWPCLSLHVEDECRDRLSSLLLLRAWPRAEPSLNVCGWVGGQGLGEQKSGLSEVKAVSGNLQTLSCGVESLGCDS